MTTIEGVDYAFPPNPAPAVLAAAGKTFACRYGGPGSAAKQLTAAELAGLNAAGIAVVANAEGTAGGLAGGYAAGKSWAQQAEAHFRSLGMPADRPIYLSVDFDAGASHWAALDAAMDGAASVLGRERVGVYGGYRVIEHYASMKDRLATWYWQTYAWSGGRWHAAAHIQQYRNGVTIGGADCDLNRAMKADYGQWGVDMALTDDDVRKIWGWDLLDGPDVEKAYLMLKRSADKATAAAKGVSDLEPATPVIDAAVLNAAVNAAVTAAFADPAVVGSLVDAVAAKVAEQSAAADRASAAAYAA